MIRKELVAASAESLVLSLLANGESYGYAMIQEIKARSGNHLEWADGMLYPVLHRMERKGWIDARWKAAESGRKRKYYAITRAGRKALQEQTAQWTLVHSVLTGLLEAQHV